MDSPDSQAPAAPAPSHQGGATLSPLAAPGTQRTLTPKTAWLLWVFLGWWGADRFYLREYWVGAITAALSVVAALLVWAIVGVVPAVAVAALWIASACTMNSRLKALNARIHAHNRAPGAR